MSNIGDELVRKLQREGLTKKNIAILILALVQSIIVILLYFKLLGYLALPLLGLIIIVAIYLKIRN